MECAEGWPLLACPCNEYTDGIAEDWDRDQTACLDCRELESFLLLRAMERIAKSRWGIALTRSSEDPAGAPPRVG
jgi:hypothetical protein